MNHSKSNTTIMICVSVYDTLLPPSVIYQSEHLYHAYRKRGYKANQAWYVRGCRFNRNNHG